jgi:hypothetical protein
MTCIIQDKALNLDGSAVVGKNVTFSPTYKDPFIKQPDSVYRVGEYTSITVATSNDGLFTEQLPWPSETRYGTSLQWQITLPDGAIYVGVVPEGLTGPLTVDDLVQFHGWGVVATAATQVIAIVGPRGPQGLPGSGNPASTTVLGAVLIDRPPASGDPVALTLQSLGIANGVASLDAQAHVPLAQLSGITSSQLSGTAGISSGQITSLDAGKLVGTLSAAVMPSNIPKTDAQSITWSNATPGAPVLVESNAMLWQPSQLNIGAAIATQRTYYFKRRTISAGSAFNVVKAATLAISGPPSFTPFATVTRAWAFNIESGAMLIDGSPPTTAQYGQISLGVGPWDGTAGGYNGGGSGVGTYIAADVSSNWDGEYIDFQDQGTVRFAVRGFHNQATGTGHGLRLAPQVFQSGSANFNGIFVNVGGGGAGSGGMSLLRLQRLGIDEFVVSDAGLITVSDGAALAVGSGSGFKIGTATTQKIGFFNSTPIVKPTVTGSRGGNAALASALTQLANLGLIVDSSSA